ncbi:NADPH:quinone reductase [Aliagarivorans taiwanensis]|uniref:NADPH:quinone reductase n=1 Tax=Aliagarivorans taiwanensis TaxID=561966 RepID=UPI00040BFAD4|nr:NADPH:quinone reductase [Aliagarivorans taiwanensis]
MKAMQSERYGSQGVLQLQDVATPEIQADQVLVQVMAAGVNPVDTYIAAGSNNYSTTFPHTPGKDGAGIIAAVGEQVQGFSLGQRVYLAGSVSGTSAEYCVCNAGQVHPLHDKLSFAQGACLGVPYATAWRALFVRAKVQAGESVLIHGASGAVGIAALQFAKAYGCKVIATAGSEQGAELLQSLGADSVLNHHDESHFQAIIDAGGADVILEMLANINLGKDLPCLNKGGRVVVIGNRGTVEINPRDLMARDAAVLGMALANADPEQLQTIHAAIAEGMASGVVEPIIGQRFALTELEQAHVAVLESGACGNIVVEVAQP